MRQARFDTLLAVEVDAEARSTYELNHPDTVILSSNIREISIATVKEELNGKDVHLLAGCPPCQGFSAIRRLNRTKPVKDERNDLIDHFVRFIEGLQPFTFMMENVPGLTEYELFTEAITRLDSLGYKLDYDVVNVKDYGVPQSRKRLVLVGSRLGEIKIATPSNDKKTVRQTIGHLPLPADSTDWLHKVFPKHTPEVQERIELTPKNGGSRKDLPKKYTLKCHVDSSMGFNDVYGRLRWDDVSTTITCGCLNPSKGRFLHPEQDRCISAREAALIQTFPPDYKFDKNATKTSIATQIGNALPPQFSYIQSLNIFNHLQAHARRLGL